MRDDHGGHRDAAVLDLSASINPLGLSPRVSDAILAALPAVTRYPDPRASALVEALARHHGIPAHHVVAGHGATELIYLLARAVAPRRALVVHPAFSEYEAALEPLGCGIVRVVATARDGWTLPLEAIVRHLDQVDLVLLANPGSPTGALVPAPLLETLAERCDRAGVVLGIDEAFVDFVEAASLKRRVTRYARLAIIRSLTKFFALPGLRLGYAFLGEAVRARVEPWREPWSVSALAEAAGVAALGDADHQVATRRLIPEWRAALASGLERRGFRVYPAAANYVCARLERGALTAAALRAALLAEGVAIRDCASFPGMGGDHVRIAVARPEQQRIFFAALDRALAQSEGAATAPSEASPRIGSRRRSRRSNRG